MSRRRRRNTERKPQDLRQMSWHQPRYTRSPIEVLSGDEVEHIHQAGFRILQKTGMTVLSDRARDRYASAGFTVDGERVFFDSQRLESLLGTIPPAFTLRARNPDKDLRLGENRATFCAVGGPAYVMDIDHGRRNGTYAETCDFMRLVQSLDILHQEGGGGFEALDLPAQSRHLDLYYAECTLLDKNWIPWTIGREQSIDAIEMVAISLGLTTEELVDQPALAGIINTNSPLQLDIPMAEGLIAMAEYGQAVVITPFTLAGAMAPVTLAGALAQQHAEAMAGMALAQIVRPGSPVVYGGFTSNVDMKTGSPAFGTPEYVIAAQASGQLARRLGVPLRSSNVNAANSVDAQAAWESTMALWGAIGAQASMIKHAAGWLHGGLTASFEKLIVDADLLQMMAVWLKPIEVSDATLGLDAISEVGPGGHFFGCDHTMERYETAFYQPLVSNWDNYETWLERGSVSSEQRANTIWKQLLEDYEQPPIDAAVNEALDDYVSRRKLEIGVN